MKQTFLVLIAIFSLMVSCGSFTPTPKQQVSRAATFQSGNKSNGVVILSLTYNPLKEVVTVNGKQTEDNASQICRNWGYTGARLQTQDQYLSRCIQFNFSTGDCVLYKTELTAVCY